MFKIKLSNMLIESSPPPSVAMEVHGAPQGNSVTVTENKTLHALRLQRSPRAAEERR